MARVRDLLRAFFLFFSFGDEPLSSSLYLDLWILQQRLTNVAWWS